MSDKPIAMLVTAAAIAPVCALCVLGPAVLGSPAGRDIRLAGRHGSGAHDGSDDRGRSFGSSHDTPEKGPNPGPSRAVRADTGPSTEPKPGPKPGSYLNLGAVEKNAPAWHGKPLQGEPPKDDWLNGFGGRLDGQPHWHPKVLSSTGVGTHFLAWVTGMEVQ